MSYKLILVMHEPGYEDDDQGSLQTQDCTVGELLNHTHRQWELQEDIYRLLSDMLDKGDERVLNELRQRGWVNEADAKECEEKLVPKHQYYVFSRPQGIGARMVPFDPKQPHGPELRDLANGAVVVQEISTPSVKKVLPKTALQDYNRQVKYREADLERRRKAAEKREANKKKRQIAKAKKILEAAGEIT